MKRLITKPVATQETARTTIRSKRTDDEVATCPLGWVAQVVPAKISASMH